MKAPKEVKQYVNNERSRSGKKNGVVKWLFEHYGWEIKDGTDKHNNRRNRHAMSRDLKQGKYNE